MSHSDPPSVFDTNTQDGRSNTFEGQERQQRSENARLLTCTEASLLYWSANSHRQPLGHSKQPSYAEDKTSCHAISCVCSRTTVPQTCMVITPHRRCCAPRSPRNLVHWAPRPRIFLRRHERGQRKSLKHAFGKTPSTPSNCDSEGLGGCRHL